MARSATGDMTLGGTTVLGLTLAIVCAAGCSVNRHAGPVVAEVTLRGVESVDEDELLDGLETRKPKGWFFVEDTAYDNLAPSRDRDRIGTFYRKQGFFTATVKTSVTKQENGDAEVVFAVEEGARARIKSVQINGVPPLSPGIRRRERHLEAV